MSRPVACSFRAPDMVKKQSVPIRGRNRPRNRYRCGFPSIPMPIPTPTRRKSGHITVRILVRERAQIPWKFGGMSGGLKPIDSTSRARKRAAGNESRLAAHCTGQPQTPVCPVCVRFEPGKWVNSLIVWLNNPNRWPGESGTPCAQLSESKTNK